jgi:hypothetical protein
MFPNWCYWFPLLILAIVAGVLGIAVWEAFWFVVHHWTWIWPHLKHAVHWWLLGN